LVKERNWQLSGISLLLTLALALSPIGDCYFTSAVAYNQADNLGITIWLPPSTMVWELFKRKHQLFVSFTAVNELDHIFQEIEKGLLELSQ